MGMKGQRGSVKMFGKEIEFPLGGKEGKKKEFLPLRFRKRISEVGCTQTRLYVCGGCANHYFSANVLSVFFFFVDSCWKGEFLSWLALTSTREAEAAFRATSYPVGGAINEHERERDGRVADREREREGNKNKCR